MTTNVLKMSTLSLLLALFSVGFHSCEDDKDIDDGSVLTQQDRFFASNATVTNLTEIEFAQMALQRSENDTIMAYARKIIVDHVAARNQLDSVTSKLDMVLPDTMERSHRALYAEYSKLTGYSFDSAYIDRQVIDHVAIIDLLQKQINDGNHARLVDYATRLLPVVTRHQQDATVIREEIIEGSGPVF